jgi:hypothetical protein
MNLDYQKLPELSDYTSEEAASVQKLIDEHDAKLAEWRSDRDEYWRLNEALGDATGRDNMAQALAERRGAKIPGNVHADKVRKAMSEVEERVERRARALELIKQDLGAELTKHQGPLSKEACSHKEKAAQTYAELYQRLRAAHDAYHAHEGEEKWFLNPTPYCAPTSPHMAMLNLPGDLRPEEPDEREGTVRLVG